MQNQKSKTELQDISSYDEPQKCIALLKLILIGQGDIENQRTRALKKAFSHIRKRIKEK